MKTIKKEIIDKLKEKRIKITNQRLNIIEEILKSKGHFEVEDLVYKIKKKNIDASRATIYRTLNILKDLGYIVEVIKLNNKTYYEFANKEHHDHLLCLNCGKIIEFHDDEIEKLQNSICEKYNFKPVYHRLEIFGICEECVKKEAPSQ